MAAAVCSLSQGSGAEKLHEYFTKQSRATRLQTGIPSTYASKTWPQFYFNRTMLLHWTHGRWLEIKKQKHHQQVFFECRHAYSDHMYEGEKEEYVTRATLIWRAIKLPIYCVALIPLTVGTALAFLHTGVLSAGRFFMLLASSIFVMIWLNLSISLLFSAFCTISFFSSILSRQYMSNDVYDFDTGADKNKKESVVNLVGSRIGTFIAAYSSLAIGFFGLTWISVEAGSLHAMLLLASAIFCGYIYQCPPFRLSYQGLGEPLCFAAFGPFATTAFYVLLGSTSGMNNLRLTGTVVAASLLVGFTTALILFCSHFHQVEGDRAVGKMSPMVRLGTEGGSRVVKVAVMILYSLLLTFGLSRMLPFPCVLLCALTLPTGKFLVSFVYKNHRDTGKIFMAKYYCVRLHAFFGAALTAGMVAARMVSKR